MALSPLTFRDLNTTNTTWSHYPGGCWRQVVLVGLDGKTVRRKPGIWDQPAHTFASNDRRLAFVLAIMGISMILQCDSSALDRNPVTLGNLVVMVKLGALQTPQCSNCILKRIDSHMVLVRQPFPLWTKHRHRG